MKITQYFTAIALLLGTSVFANPHPETRFMMTAVSKIMLNNIDTDSASFWVSNPGKASGICGLVLSSLSNHEDFYDLSVLLNRFEITTLIPGKPTQSGPRFTRFSLVGDGDLYINILQMKTKDGKSISENLKAFYKYNAPTMMTVDFCKRL